MTTDVELGLLGPPILWQAVFLFIFGCGLCISAAADPKIRETHQDWTVICDTPEHIGKEVCLIVQQKNLRDTQKPVLRVEIGFGSENGKAFAVITAPLGIALEPGLSMIIDDGESEQYDFNSCIPTGCVVGANLSETQIDALLMGSEAQFSFKDSRGRQLTVPISLIGFTAALNSIKP